MKKEERFKIDQTPEEVRRIILQPVKKPSADSSIKPKQKCKGKKPEK